MNKQDQRPDNRDVAPNANPSQLADLPPKAEQTEQISGGGTQVQSGAQLQLHGGLTIQEGLTLNSNLNGNLQIANFTNPSHK